MSLAAAASDDTAPLQQVEVRGPGSSQLRRDEAVGRIVIGRDDLQRYGETTLADALKRQPGLSVVGGEIRMRGLGAGYTQILIDGQPAPANFDIATLSPELIERVEIQRSAQVDASAQSVAGSLNIVLRKAAGAARSTAKISAERQAGETSPTATVQWIARSGAVGYGLTTTASETRRRDRIATGEQTSDAGVTAVRRLEDEGYTRTRRLSAAPRADVKLDGGNTLTWQGLVDLSHIDARGAQSEDTLQGSPTASPDSNWRSLSKNWLVKSDLAWMQRFDAGSLTLKAGVEAGNRDGDYLFHGIDAGGTPWLNRAVLSRAYQRRANTSGKYLTPLAAGHDVVIGWDASQVRREESRHQRDTNPRQPDAAPSYTLDQDYNASVEQVALFAQDEWSVTPRLQAYLGLRWEGLETRTWGPGKAATASRVWSPVAQVAWKLPDSARDQLRLALARTYKAPQPRDLVPRRYTINNDNGPTQPDYQGNPSLRPELAWGLDAALESYFARDAMVSVSAYVRRIQDVVQLRLWQENGVWVSSPANGGVADVRGVEIDARVPLKLAWAGGTTVELRTNLSRNWSRVEGVAGPDNRLGNQAPLTANLGMDWRMPQGRGAGANLRFVGGWRARTAQSLVQETGVVRELEAYATWPAAGGRLRLTVANLLQSARNSGKRYNDGLYASTRLSLDEQRPVFRFQYEVQQ
ncbi:TonB-dependent receptor [Oxalobacteraceae bacterium OTU3CINTB1]|nr:TonB-dependent receptor [Oxalobacteraceae bacterium OTU3CINTB1]